MFWKKNRIGCWTLLLAGLVGLIGFGHGYLVHRNQVFPYQWLQRMAQISGWRRYFPKQDWRPVSGRQKQPSGDLLTMPYLAGYQPDGPQPEIVVHQPEQIAEGLNLYTSGHAPEALLIDRNGRIRHSWSIEKLTHGHPHAPPISARFIYPEWGYWRRAHLYPNGDLLVIYENAGMLKLDRDSNVIWSFWGGCHHDLFVADDDSIHVLGKEELTVPQIREREPIWHDWLYRMNGDGVVLSQISIPQSLIDGGFSPLLDGVPEDRDILHTNTVFVIDSSTETPNGPFRRGRILVTLRNIDAVALIDPSEAKVVWAMTGPWRRPHEARILPGGDLLIYNNLYSYSESQILQINPLTQAVAWSYNDPERPFFSRILGAVQRLPNGNTLITESTKGGAFEVTPDGVPVWAFTNPNRAGEHGELIATLFEMTRYGSSYFDQDFLTLIQEK